MRIALSRPSELARGRLGRLVRYGIVGVVSNLCLIALLFLLVRAGVGAVPAAMIVYVLGVAGTYAANKMWSFRSRVSHFKAGPRYVLVHALCAGTVAALQFVGHDRLGIDAVLVQVFAMAIVVLPLFVLMERFAFSPAGQS